MLAIAPCVSFLIAAVPMAPVEADVLVVFGNGKPNGAPMKFVPQAVYAMDKTGQFRSGAVILGKIDFSEHFAKELKKQPLCRVRIDLDDPNNTPAGLVLKVIDDAHRAAKDGTRIELKLTYPPR